MKKTRTIHIRDKVNFNTYPGKETPTVLLGTVTKTGRSGYKILSDGKLYYREKVHVTKR